MEKTCVVTEEELALAVGTSEKVAHTLVTRLCGFEVYSKSGEGKLTRYEVSDKEVRDTAKLLGHPIPEDMAVCDFVDRRRQERLT